MLYPSLFSGEKIDQLLEFAGQLKPVTTGWVKLDSSEENPVDLNNLTNPGNFGVDHWINGPIDDSLIPPLNATISKSGNTIKQFIFDCGITGSAYLREYNLTDGSFNEFKCVTELSGAQVSTTPPENPSEGEMWFNPTSESPLSFYNGTSWSTITPPDHMDPTIYNSSSTSFPSGIYQYIDDEIATIIGPEESIDSNIFITHINDNQVHLTEEDKNNYATKMTTTQVDSSVETIMNQLDQHIQDKATQAGADPQVINDKLDAVSTAIDTHSNDSTMHPSTEQIADWDSKAEVNHTHTGDQIIITPENVENIIEDKNIPESAISLTYPVNTVEEMLALTAENLNIHDMVFVVNDKTLYRIINYSKLGTMEAFSLIGAGALSPEDLTWDNVMDKPTTLTELCTDAITNEEVDTNISELTTTNTSVSEKLEVIKTIDINISDNILKSNIIESLIDLIDCKMKTIRSIING